MLSSHQGSTLFARQRLFLPHRTSVCEDGVIGYRGTSSSQKNT